MALTPAQERERQERQRIGESAATAAASQPRPPSRKVFLRNDSMGMRYVHDADHQAVELRPGQVREVDMPLKVMEILERDSAMQAQRGNMRVLRAISRDEARRMQEPARQGGPTTEQARMLDLAQRAGDMNFADLQVQAQELLGDRYPRGRPNREEIVAVLNQHGRMDQAAPQQAQIQE